MRIYSLCFTIKELTVPKDEPLVLSPPYWMLLTPASEASPALHLTPKQNQEPTLSHEAPTAVTHMSWWTHLCDLTQIR